MQQNYKVNDAVPVNRIFLYLENPRHEPVENEQKAIEHLCAKENVFPLARDISRHRLSPLERLALIPTGRRSSSEATQAYFAAEGNRRICAIKLLNDPDLAPANLRKAFEKLSESWTPVKTISAAIFNDIEDVRLWLDRVHSGPQGGVGRKDWTSEQKTRFDGDSKNRSSQSLLDYAEREKFLTKEDRAGKLTTVQRFIGNDVFRETLGFDHSDPDEPSRTRPKGEFDIIFRKFIRDLIDKRDVNSRMNKKQIIAYAVPLSGLTGVTSTRIPAEPLSSADDSPPKKGKSKVPTRPKVITHVQHEEEIAKALQALGNTKLTSLYHSICSIDLDPHTPLVSVGAWSFFETLTACAGREERTDFCSFLSRARLATYGFTGETKAYRTALERIKDFGNSTKHHPTAATFNGAQLNNDMASLKGIILKCIDNASKSAP